MDTLAYAEGRFGRAEAVGAAQALVLEEMQQQKRLSEDEHPALTALPSVRFSELIEAELQRIKDGRSTPAFDKQRYCSVLDTAAAAAAATLLGSNRYLRLEVDEADASGASEQSALERCCVLLEMERMRVLNASLGAQLAPTAHQRLLGALRSWLDGALDDERRRLEQQHAHINVQRQREQMQQAQILRNLESEFHQRALRVRQLHQVLDTHQGQESEE